MDKFLHFESIDFAQDESFINWVRASNPSDINRWNKWIADHPEKREIIDKAKILVNNIKFTSEETTSEVEDKIWGNINAATTTNNSLAEQKPSSVFRLLKRWAPIAAAAMIALLVYVNISLSTSYDTTLTTTFAQNKQELLPDESIIDINAESHIAYSKTNWESNREIKLKGEAFFSVKKGSKFTVVTDNGNVEVLGTSFNVYSRGSTFAVECETGKVSVTTEGKEIILTPNEGVRIDLANNEVSKIEIKNNRSTWRRGSFNYKDVEISQVFDDIERHFGIKITDNQVPTDQSYTGGFNAINIDTVLHQICWPLNLEVSKSDEGYHVSSTKK